MSKKVKVYYIKHPTQEETERNSDFWQRYLRMTTSYTEEEAIPLKKDYRKVTEWEAGENTSDYEILNKMWSSHQNLDYQENAANNDRSMMVGDVIEIDGQLFKVASIGFSETEWN